jgi:hypothetical protein
VKSKERGNRGKRREKAQRERREKLERERSRTKKTQEREKGEEIGKRKRKSLSHNFIPSSKSPSIGVQNMLK